ncbi:MAG: hypothetical protein CVV64_15810 [Candidatus Wallbacteria bacterium HGW-Wallbacteria-1]|jgi:hypothetical protein|uniref:Uncharacterized protein n=1 Tax=Candidatus Wallbacteria bacterium HGW-Wallbacteria-1 TaxID=2013854 RepID=A0A2N1PLC4_9BACT|nr:MAG: hypothetical protein CVV64_15810 [Candidatus Wallbacteria bacterium HGW-Wallbacteria-1]
MNWTTLEVIDLIDKINREASVNYRFRLLCLENPRKAISEITGKDVPEGFSLKIVDPSMEMVVRLGPMVGASDPCELLDKELEHIAGGKDVLEQIRSADNQVNAVSGRNLGQAMGEIMDYDQWIARLSGNSQQSQGILSE